MNAASTLTHSNEISTCPDCGDPLQNRRFVEAWDLDGKPHKIDSSHSYPYCGKCKLKWIGELVDAEDLIAL